MIDDEAAAVVAHNDQTKAGADEDLNELLLRARNTYAQAREKGHPSVVALGIIAETIIEQEDVMYRRRVCSLLAVALERLIAYEDRSQS